MNTIVNKILWTLSAGLVLISCHTYKEYDKKSFPTYIWTRGQEITFQPVIEDITTSYSLALGIRHLYGFPLKSIPVNLVVVSPSGRETSHEYDLQIMKEQGKYIGSCGGDLCDLETVVNQELKFAETGKYKFILSHNLDAEKIPGVMEFGIIIDEN